jgi:single-stranded-DNA-specific exonuclease
MSLGIECLLCEDEAQALSMAQELNRLNEERRRIENEMKTQAVCEVDKIIITEKALPLSFSLFDEHWHQGVIGILAARIKDKFHRPVIAFAVGQDDQLKGSARSIKGLHIRDILANIDVKVPGLLLKFGGHAQAAGLTILRKNIDAFRQYFEKEVALHLSAEMLQNEITSDGELHASEINLRLAQMLKDGGPWGQHFPEPIFDGAFALLDQRIIQGKHLKCRAMSKENRVSFDAIAFNVDVNKWPNVNGCEANIAYRLDINEYRGERNVQLLIEHLEVC